ncbi:MAG: TetR/AcrR family transcriptional regulator [Pseudomonadota bacterium]
MEKTSYHHGDLRAALLEAGERLLSETSVENFSLRRVAKETGVSHSAPAHHFGDVSGLLTALADEGFKRLKASMVKFQREAGTSAEEQLIASGRGYVRFAEESPALFRLMFTSQRVATNGDAENTPPILAFQHLVDDVQELWGADPSINSDAMVGLIGCWTMAHGLAELSISGRLSSIRGSEKIDRDALFSALFASQFPSTSPSK